MSGTEGSLRKSKRQHVPNPIYSAGINELKMETHSKTKKKGKGQDSQFEEDIPSLQVPNNSRPESHDRWLHCVMESGKKMKLQVIPPTRQTYEEGRKKAKQSKKESPNLLSIFQKVIENVQKSQDGQSQNIQQMIPREARKPPFLQSNKVRKQKVETDGKITKLEISEGLMKIDQSKLGKIEIPVDWNPSDSVKVTSDEGVEEMRKKLNNYKNIVGIEIFSS